MRAVIIGLIVAGVSACSSSDAPASNGCTHASQCVSAICRCNLGTGDKSPATGTCAQGQCETIDQLCSDHCKSNGGVASQDPAPSIIGSADCNAFCDRWTKDCGGPCAIQACNVGYCEAATTASLQCYAKKGISDCENFLVIDVDCIQENFSASCPPTGDAGPDADAAPETSADAGADGDDVDGDGG